MKSESVALGVIVVKCQIYEKWQMTRMWLLTFNRVHLFVQPGAVEQAGAGGVEVKACGSLGFIYKSTS